MTGPGWQLIGDEAHVWTKEQLAEWTANLKPSGILMLGHGSRIEYIGPRVPSYNWAEGSRAIEARREAAEMRQRAYGRRIAWESMNNYYLGLALAQLNHQMNQASGLRDLLEGRAPSEVMASGSAIQRLIEKYESPLIARRRRRRRWWER